MNKKILVLLILIVIGISSIIITQPNVSTVSVNHGNFISPYLITNNSTYVWFNYSTSYQNTVKPYTTNSAPNSATPGAIVHINVPNNINNAENNIIFNIDPNLILLVDGTALYYGHEIRLNYTTFYLIGYNAILTFGSNVQDVNVNITILPEFTDLCTNSTGVYIDKFIYYYLPDYMQSAPIAYNYISTQYVVNSSAYYLPTYNYNIAYSATSQAGYLFSLNTYMQSFTINYKGTNTTPIYYIFTFLSQNYTSSKVSTSLLNTNYRLYLNFSLPNGTYSYIETPVIFYNNTYIDMINLSVSGYIVIDGANVVLNVVNPPTILNLEQVYLYVYLTISSILIIAILKISNGLIMAYSMASSLFMLIGYNLQLPYFNPSMIMSVITLVIGLFIYIYIWSD